MLKKLSLILVAAGLLLLPSCSCNINIDPSMTITYEEDEDAVASTLKNLDNGNVELYIDMGIFDISTEEEAEALKNDKGYESVIIDEENYMVTIVMTPAQYQQAIDDLVAEIDELVADSLTDNLVSVEHNEDFTEWNIVTSDGEVSFFDSVYGLSLAVYSGDYFKITPNVEYTSMTLNWYSTDGTLIDQQVTDFSNN